MSRSEVMSATPPRSDEIRSAILDLLAQRDPSSSICPSEAARDVFGDWREHMDDVRAVAAQMQDDGEIYATQGENRVSVASASGPIRLRTPSSDAADGS